MKRIWNDGDVRERTGFLWLPKKIDGDTRWFSREKWLEVCEFDPSMFPEWRSIGWLKPRKNLNTSASPDPSRR